MSYTCAHIRTCDKILSVKANKEVQLCLTLHNHKHLDQKKVNSGKFSSFCVYKLSCSKCNQGEKYEIMRL